MSDCVCSKELSSQSQHSPGRVLSLEPIVLALVDPLTFENGGIKPISKSQLKSSTLSVCRALHVEGKKAKELTVDILIASKPERLDCGFAYALCSEIRDIRLETLNLNAFCVIDDAYEHYTAHAHIGFSEVNDTKNDRVTARGNLLQLFKRRGVFFDWGGEPFIGLSA